MGEDDEGDFEDEVEPSDVIGEPEQKPAPSVKEAPKTEVKPEIKLAEPRKGAPLKIAMADAQTFLDCVTAISDIIAEISISVTPSGIIMRAMDPANVAMVNCVMKPAAFVEYDVPESGDFGVKLSELKQILKSVKGSACKMEFASKIKIEGMGKSKKAFTMSVIELEEKKQKLPEMQFKTELKISTDTLKEYLKDMELVGESCHFVMADNKFSMKAAGDLNDAKVDISEAQIVKGEKGEARYSLEYLKKMMTKLSDNVTVKFGVDCPCQLEYKKDTIELTFLLTPRVEND